MKKLLSLVMVCGLILVAINAMAAEKRLTFATGGTSGVYFPLGGAIAQVLTAKSNGALDVTAQASGASVENIRLIDAGEVNMAIVQNDIADAAYNGTAPFKKKFPNARAIARLYPEYLHIVASTNSNIKKMADFKGHKVSVGVRGSGNELNCRQIFKFFGLSYKNITPMFLPYGDTAEQFKDRLLDGFIFTIGTPNPAIQDITTAQEVRFIPLQDSDIDAITKQFPYLVKDSIPANTYKGQTQPVPTLSVQAILIVNKNMSDEDAYNITKTLFDNLPEIANEYDMAAEISLKQAKNGITIPFHPGAEKYFKEKGLGK
ncbi:MAG: TAXI family TRAP transporter solute-binding subunit [Desulfovibrionaceae bacterium]|nr:TAXI family TRAP transporter solute-binding subunit [Desulfovibrionaceae bacterium]